MTLTPWWRDAVIYQVYPRSFADADGDGLGDLPGITARLDHLAHLGVDAVWLSPFYRSPQHDGGYDVADFRDVDPRFGTLDDLDALVARAHALDLRVIVDVVPNHTSSDHAWFQQAIESPAGSPERARYVFRDPDPDGSLPNNWTSNFGGPAWSSVAELVGPERAKDLPDTDQLYLHLFDVTQPDLDWTDPEVPAELESVLRFWLDRGVDGFRIDVAHGLIKADGLPDADPDYDQFTDATASQPMWDQPGVHEIYRSWRHLTDSYGTAGADDDRILCGEAWVEPAEALARYVRPDELHQSFNFHFLYTPWNADAMRESITESLASAEAVGAPQTWVLSNHDVPRHATRLGLPGAEERIETFGRGPDDPQPDAALGLRRARAATALMLALPGSAYLYQGEELGLPDATRLPDDALRDPRWERSGHTVRGRDGCRVPVPWVRDAPSFGFGPGGRPWLPQPPEYGDLAVDQQDGHDDSTLELYRRLLRVRRDRRLGRGPLRWIDTPPGVLAFAVEGADSSTTVVTTFADASVSLGDPSAVLAASAPLDAGSVPVDTTVWLDGFLAFDVDGHLG